MQLLGAWMIKTPLARAAAIARFIAGASSPTRRVAPWHQCWFHMSQMMMAVCDGFHSRTFSLTTYESAAEPLEDLPGSRVRACSTSGDPLLRGRLLGLGRERQNIPPTPIKTPICRARTNASRITVLPDQKASHVAFSRCLTHA